MYLNLYLVKRTDQESPEYDTYSSFVCMAKDTEQARQMLPDQSLCNLEDDPQSPWPTPNRVKVQYLGQADSSYSEARVILVSEYAW